MQIKELKIFLLDPNVVIIGVLIIKNSCEMVHDRGFVKMCQNLSYLTQLEHLTLQIIKYIFYTEIHSRLGLITNESLLGISSTLSNALPKLIKLDLIFKE